MAAARTGWIRRGRARACCWAEMSGDDRFRCAEGASLVTERWAAWMANTRTYVGDVDTGTVPHPGQST